MKNPGLYEEYLNEESTMTVIIRLFAKKSLANLWKDIEKNIKDFQSKDLTPLYASQQEAKDYVSLICEAKNFESLKHCVVENMTMLSDVRKTRTACMLEPTYFLLPKEHPKDLNRYLLSLEVDPQYYQPLRSKMTSQRYPDNVFLTYLAYSLGEDDLLLSILTDTQKTAAKFAKDTFDDMEGVRAYEVSNQLKTLRLASKEKWKEHQEKFLSSFDKEHSGEYDAEYDWMVDFQEHALMTGAFRREL